MTTATESYDSLLKSICYLIGGVFVFSLQDVIIKWISGKYPVWGYIFWKDILEPQAVIGMVLIVGSGLYIFGNKKLLTNKYVLSIFKIKIRR